MSSQGPGAEKWASRKDCLMGHHPELGFLLVCASRKRWKPKLILPLWKWGRIGVKILERLEEGYLTREDSFKALNVSKIHLNPLVTQTKQGQMLSFILAWTRTEFLSGANPQPSPNMTQWYQKSISPLLHFCSCSLEFESGWILRQLISSTDCTGMWWGVAFTAFSDCFAQETTAMCSPQKPVRKK